MGSHGHDDGDILVFWARNQLPLRLDVFCVVVNFLAFVASSDFGFLVANFWSAYSYPSYFLAFVASSASLLYCLLMIYMACLIRYLSTIRDPYHYFLALYDVLLFCEFMLCTLKDKIWGFFALFFLREFRRKHDGR